MQKLILNGREYDDVPKALNRVPLLHWIELEDQANVTADQVDEGSIGWRKMLACYAFLLRRAEGEDVTFAQVAGETVPEDVIVPDADDDQGEPEVAQIRPTDASKDPSGV